MQAEKAAQSAQLHDPEHDHAGTSVPRRQGVLDPVEKAECERFGNGLSPNMPVLQVKYGDWQRYKQITLILHMYRMF